ncbi:hypothetical protein Misp01_27690 [Microtetraspora sp. NBRC 13810]|uniref:sensor histidine kinase n=1 Tax=Microtetraspora sp. NBRC 13810 TaxID=3030990 RepID=UPI0024A59213|nr:nitrate- and nitrite sensing domain-containing protein [Microtetraspora sp. NBRC 13810]GLW07639.1 hypothetical protein Misp01_27690 [Microtetraspora sp. NBRC 13810]
MRSAPPIRVKILRILLVPLISLITLWAYLAYVDISAFTGLAHSTNRYDAVGAPTRALIVEIQRERQLTAALTGRTAGDPELKAQRERTDRAAARIRDVAAAVQQDPHIGPPPENIQALLNTLGGLPALRDAADLDQVLPLRTTEAFNALVTVANSQFGDSEVSDVYSYQVLRGLSFYGSAAEYLARENAVLTVALARGRMTPAEHASFVAAMTSRRLQLTNAGRDMGPELTALHARLEDSDAYKRFEQAEDELYRWNVVGPPPVDPDSWGHDAGAAFAGLNGNTDQELRRATLKGRDLAVGGLMRIGLVLGLGLLAVVLSIWASYRFGRSLVNELKRLQDSAVELAEVRLPKLVERLRKGEHVNPAAEAPELEPARTAEVGRVVEAFSAVRRTAVEAAVGQAVLRKGVGQVFLNLARRNQTLLHRQLTLLDTMEREVEEPETLEGLFKLDHLTTRMRRHAENLIILADAAPGRRWRDPVPLYDVVRSSVLEVEDYTRVTVLAMPQAPLLVGPAVTDVIHLIAELVENATVFSPPNTAVQVRGSVAANGFALEVEDRGLGLNPATMAELNAQLATHPEFDLAGTDRMGLFVVSRLAARHGIKVRLRPSPYDGTTAIVMLPPSLLAEPAPDGTPGNGVSLFDAGPLYPAGRTMSAAAPAVRGMPPVRALTPAPRPFTPPLSAPVPAPPIGPGRDSHRDNHRDTHRDDDFDDLDGLPVRVRQASLAPQLRKPPARKDRDVTTRSPEELLDLMTSMQEGWRKGRSEAERHRDVWNGKDLHDRRES